MSKRSILPLMFGLSNMFKGFNQVPGEDFKIPVDSEGMLELARKKRQTENNLSKRKLMKMRGRKNRANRGKKRSQNELL